ncbi:MAG TPA: hypothetical protein PKW07_06240 [Syntrophorhabdaceae bacterium]|nr:hypothetical protein [Syntrophorhabdaceae bacterium]
MKDRIGEKIGWTAGWAGGFIWVFILSIVLFFQGKTEQGILGIALVGSSAFMILFFSPWRFSSTQYWKLMFAPYGVFFLSIIWAIWSYGGFGAIGLNWWNLLWLLPMLTPFGILSKRKWSDSTQQSASADAAEPRR